jgi:hypothetical protein
MDFVDSLKQFASRVEKLKAQITTEEATKMSLIVPFFQMLGYDVFNPDEFMPEYVADVGIKKGEKVDYAIIKDGNPVILIEAKWCGERLGDNLTKHGSQLFRYFGTTKAKFGILTNGVVYRFFTDLDEPNKMDNAPFLEIDMLDVKEHVVSELKKFHKDSFDTDSIFSVASELKYSKAIKELMSAQLKSPSDAFVRYILSEVYDGMKNQKAMDRFTPIVRKALNDFITERMNEKISTALKKTDESEPVMEDVVIEDDATEAASVVTTQEELEAFYVVKSLLIPKISAERITYRDNETYFNVLVDDNIRKWICRLYLNGNKKQIHIRKDDGDIIKIPFESTNDLYEYADVLTAACEKFA